MSEALKDELEFEEKSWVRLYLADDGHAEVANEPGQVSSYRRHRGRCLTRSTVTRKDQIVKIYQQLPK
jgi:hypothetical protein